MTFYTNLYFGIRNMNKKHVMITINPDVLERAKKVAGLVPFSRYIENLIVLNIQHVELFSKQLEEEK